MGAFKVSANWRNLPAPGASEKDHDQEISVRASFDVGNRRTGHPENTGDLGIVLSPAAHLENHAALIL